MEDLVAPAACLSSWSGRRVLVTGHTGFKGAWLSWWLTRLGAQVWGLSLPESVSTPSLYDLLALGDAIHDHRLDITDRGAVSRLINECRPELVFHLAAQPLVRRAYTDPFATVSVNVMGLLCLLDAVRNCPSIRALICITTDKVYGRGPCPEGGYRETDPWGPADPYSTSKAAADLLATGFAQAFLSSKEGPGWGIARAGNIIGGGDWAADRILPDAVRAVTAGRPLEVRHPRAIRPWQHVLCALHGYLQLAAGLLHRPDTISGCWNFGPDAEGQVPVARLAEDFFRHWGAGSWREESGGNGHPPETSVLTLDSTKARRQLAWRPAWSHEESLRRTAVWYRHFHNGASARELVEQDLADYQERLA